MSEEKKEIKTIDIVSKKGVLAAQTLNEWWRLSGMVFKSGLAPKAFDTQEKVLVAMQMASELRIPPITSLRQMMVINGTPSLWGDLPKGICLRSRELEKCEESFLDKNGKMICRENNNLNEVAFFAECRLKRKGRAEIVRTFSWADAELAGLTQKAGGLYQKYRKRMLQMRARSWALKDEFPDLLNGVGIVEYDSDLQNIRDVGGELVAEEKKSLSEKLKEVGVDDDSKKIEQAEVKYPDE